VQKELYIFAAEGDDENDYENDDNYEDNENNASRRQ
jgi:hypothetical protein